MIERYRLENWGRWGRIDTDRPRVSAAVIYDMGGSGDPDGYADDVIPEPLPPPVDMRDAELMDSLIRRLSAGHRRVIRTRYYLRRSVDLMDDYAARRALQDIIDQ